MDIILTIFLICVIICLLPTVIVIAVPLLGAILALVALPFLFIATQIDFRIIMPYKRWRAKRLGLNGTGQLHRVWKNNPTPWVTQKQADEYNAWLNESYRTRNHGRYKV